MTTIFSWENFIPLFFIHFATFFILFWRSHSKRSSFLAETNILKSFTYNECWTFLLSSLVISVMMMAKHVTVSTLPCGIPSAWLGNSEYEAPTRTLNFQLVRKFWTKVSLHISYLKFLLSPHNVICSLHINEHCYVFSFEMPALYTKLDIWLKTGVSIWMTPFTFLD